MLHLISVHRVLVLSRNQTAKFLLVVQRLSNVIPRRRWVCDVDVEGGDDLTTRFECFLLRSRKVVSAAAHAATGTQHNNELESFKGRLKSFEGVALSPAVKSGTSQRFR